MPVKSNEIRKFIDPSVLLKIKNLELRAKKVVEGFMVGLHKSPYHGFSVEFSQHRQYMQGDSLKDVDWKVFAKSEKYFIKQYEEETNLIANIYLDSSRSMKFHKSGPASKLDYSITLAAAISYLLINQQDSVGLTIYSDKIHAYLPPKATRIYLKTILSTLAKVEPDGATETAECLKSSALLVCKRGLTVLISDFFDNPESVISAFKQFHHKNNEVIVFHVLDPVEINFGFDSDSIFVDLESDEQVTTQPYHIRRAYQSAMEEYIGRIKSSCLNYGIDYHLITTDEPFEKALMNFFTKRTKLN
jgi:uncharacterized protein (DUF58 family)